MSKTFQDYKTTAAYWIERQVWINKQKQKAARAKENRKEQRQ